MGCSDVLGFVGFITFFEDKIITYASCSIQNDDTLVSVKECTDCYVVDEIPSHFTQIRVKGKCSSDNKSDDMLIVDKGCLERIDTAYKITREGGGINVSVLRMTAVVQVNS